MQEAFRFLSRDNASKERCRVQTFAVSSFRRNLWPGGEARETYRALGSDWDLASIRSAEVDATARLAEPQVALQGDVARAYLYLAKTYGAQALPLEKTVPERLRQWAQQDPPSLWERRLAFRIDQRQACEAAMP